MKTGTKCSRCCIYPVYVTWNIPGRDVIDICHKCDVVIQNKVIVINSIFRIVSLSIIGLVPCMMIYIFC